MKSAWTILKFDLDLDLISSITYSAFYTFLTIKHTLTFYFANS